MNPPGMDVGALERFLCDQAAEVRGVLRVALISGGRSNPTFSASDDVSRCAGLRALKEGSI